MHFSLRKRWNAKIEKKLQVGKRLDKKHSCCGVVHAQDNIDAVAKKISRCTAWKDNKVHRRCNLEGHADS